MKLCILCLSANQNIFNYQEITAKNTWIKHAEENNIDVYIYKSGEKNNIVGNHIYCNTEDDLKHTYEKTIEALKQIDLDKYDYIIRTNLTTYININVLVKYCKYLNEHNYDISCGDICVSGDKYIYRGNSLIMSNGVCKYLINSNRQNINNLHDDIFISEILYNYKNLKIDVATIKYYKDTTRKNHIFYINNLNKENIDGIVFISYRVYGEERNPSYRYYELGLGYEIEDIYIQLGNQEYKQTNIVYNINNQCFEQLSK